VNAGTKCVCCGQFHQLSTCLKFKKMTRFARYELVRKWNLCRCCLSKGHWANRCDQKPCSRCNQRHHLLLHREEQSVVPMEKAREITGAAANHVSQVGMEEILLPTVQVLVMDYYGQLVAIRALMDSGSQITIISENCAQRLKLKRNGDRMELNGIGGGTTKSRGRVSIIMMSEKDPTFKLTAQAVIIPKLIKHLPTKNLCLRTNDWKMMHLADPDFGRPGRVDMIIGSHNYGSLIKERIRRQGSITAQETVFG